jgi:hypothetical protein
LALRISSGSLPELVGDLLDHPLAATSSPCGPPKPRNAVLETVLVFIGLETQPHIRVEIGVVGVKQRAVGDRAGQIGRKAAARGKTPVDGLDAAALVIADIVIDHEIVALAGDDHVVVAVGPDLHGRLPSFLAATRRSPRIGWTGFPCRRSRRPCAAHCTVTAFDGAEHMRHHVLHFARVLGRGPDGHLVILAGNGEGDMAFQIQMILAADAHLALEPERCCRKAGLDIAALELQRVW